MELFSNTSNRLTHWLVSRGVLTSPFVLVDVGVQGGINPRWNALGDHLVVYGFDLLEEEIAPLRRAAGARHHYFPIGLADQDGELDILVPENRFETKLYSSGSGDQRRVPIRRLDTLFREQIVPAADFIKMDCEGFEPVVLSGAGSFLAASNIIGVDSESNFNSGPRLTNTHFSQLCDPLVRERLLVFDLQFNRLPVIASPTFETGICRPATLNVLFARHLVQERDSQPS